MTVALVAAGLVCCFMRDALPDDMTGHASIIDGDTLEIHGTRIRFGASMLRRAASFVAAKTVSSTAALRRRRTNLTRSLRDDR